MATVLSRPVSEPAVLTTVALGTMLAPLNSTMIIVALPSIMSEFNADAATAAWLVTAYLIAMASLQPVAGKLGDRLGRRPLILGGLSCFGLTSLVAPLAPGLGPLVLLRVIQAISGSVAIPNGDALVRELVPAERRAGRFGLIGSAIAFAAAAGPPLGGLIVGLAGWRAIFLANLLLVGPALALGWRVLPGRSVRHSEHRFDFLGAALLCTLLVGTAGLLSQLRRGDLPVSPIPIAALLLLLLGLFLARELRHPEPVLQPRFFARRAFAAATAGVALSNLAMYCTLLALPLLLAQVGWHSLEVGLLLAAMAGVTVLVAPFGGRLADRFGRRWPAVAGLAVQTLGFLVVGLGCTGPTLSLPLMVVGLALGGAGLGLSQAGLQTSALESVERRHAGVASGTYSTSRYFGSIVGSSLLAGLVGPAHDTTSFSAVFVMIVLAAALATIAAFALRDRSAALG